MTEREGQGQVGRESEHPGGCSTLVICPVKWSLVGRIDTNSLCAFDAIATEAVGSKGPFGHNKALGLRAVLQ